MALYPSLDLLNGVSDSSALNDHILVPVKKNESSIIPAVSISSSTSTSTIAASLYPALTEYMDIDISKHTNQLDNGAADKTNCAVAVPTVRGQVTNGLRKLTLCKDAKGRVGLMVSSINNGVFVCFVLAKSPAALGGLRFGDQILQINETVLAGYSADKVHDMIRKLPVNNIHLVIRDRPFERCVTMQKDNIGRVGFEFNNGKIVSLVKDSSAARNGLVTEHNLLEIQGQNVIGMSDKDMLKIIESAGAIVTVTIVPSFLYKQMIKNMKAEYIKAKMDHSCHV